MAIDYGGLHSLTAREIVVARMREGFCFVRQRGSHQRYRHPDGRRITVAPHGRGDTFTIKTLKSMIEGQACWTEDDLKAPRAVEVVIANDQISPSPETTRRCSPSTPRTSASRTPFTPATSALYTILYREAAEPDHFARRACNGINKLRVINPRQHFKSHLRDQPCSPDDE